MTLLDKMKLLIGIADTSKDSLLLLLLEEAERDFLDITNLEEVPLKAGGAILQMAVVKYNLLGCEGLNSQSQSGLNENYGGYSADLLKQIGRYRKLRAL